MKKLKYAIVRDSIVGYVEGSVRHVGAVTEWMDKKGNVYICERGNFLTGSLSDLSNLLSIRLAEKKKIEMQEKIRLVLNKFPNADLCEKCAIVHLVKEGYSLDEINEDLVVQTMYAVDEDYFDYIERV